VRKDASADASPAADRALARPDRGGPESSTRRGNASFAEMVCLTLVTQGVSHGWALGTMLAPDGELGRVWSLSRPLTYRAIDALVDRRLVSRRGNTAGHGRDRVLLAPTARGRRIAAQWLDEPIEHLRDVRTELLTKLVLRERDGLDSASLLTTQLARFEPMIDTLTSASPTDDIVDLWRRESARAVRRFLDQALYPAAPESISRPEMRLSARNQVRGTIVVVDHGEVMSTVKVTLPDGQTLTAAITRDAANDLDLAPGDDVVLIIKSTEVIVAKAA
jgi:PadR family transcriptional regulator AphA